MAKNLIIYYSRKGQNYVNGSIKDLEKGNTEICAEFIQKAVDGDLFEIETVRSYSDDYMKYGFQYWWVLFILGIGAAVLGFFGLRNPDVSAVTLSTLIGIAIIAVGVAYICALCGIKKFEKKVDEFREAVKGSIPVEPEQ